MLVFNHFTNDTRVHREAVGLQQQGYDVTVIARWKEGLPDRADGEYTVRRVREKPWDNTLLRWLRSPFRRRRGCGTLPAPQPAAGTGTAGRKVDTDSADASTSHTRGTGRQRGTTGKHLLVRGIKLVLLPAYLLARVTILRSHRLIVIQDFSKRARQELKNEGIDIVHAHDFNMLPLGAKLAKEHDALLVYDSHELYSERNLPPKGRPPWWARITIRRIERRLMRRAALSITVNDVIADHLARMHKVPRPLVVRNTPEKAPPTDATMGHLRKELGIPTDRKIMVYVGAVTFNRGIEPTIAALPDLPDVHLVLMGYPMADFDERVARLADENSVADRVSWFGPVPSDEVVAHLVDADVGIAPIQNVCLSYYYCLPNKVFEYLRAGLPIVASDFPEIRQVVETAGAGYLFDPSDPHAIAAAVRRTLDEGIRPKMTPEEVAARWSWEGEMDRLVEAYQALPVGST